MLRTTARRGLLLTPLLLPLGGCGAEAEAPRGVLLISIDSLRADHLSSYGYRAPANPGQPTSPAMDAMLADQGVRFETVVSTTSWISATTAPTANCHSKRSQT